VTSSITHATPFAFCFLLSIALAGCGPDYSPNTYNGSAMQQANKVDTGIVIGYREVKISDDGTIGAVTGGAAGGILGAETGSPAVPTALAALGGTVVGGVIGSTIQHTTGDTTGWEYIVRQPKGDLVSVTQRQPTPIPIGQRVLVIEGKQARIVPDYATSYDAPPEPKGEEKHDQEKQAVTNSAPSSATTSAVPAAAPGAAAAAASPASVLPAAGASPSTPGNMANGAPTPLSINQDRMPGDQPAPASPTPPAAITAPTPPASVGNGNDSSQVPPPS